MNHYPKLELISIHIPKTGGKSLMSLFSDVYGEANALRIRMSDYGDQGGDWGADIPALAAKYKIIHGHYKYKEVEHIHRNSNAKVIAWVRDPVERVVSRYYYFRKNIERGNVHDAHLDKVNMSLLDYAKLPSQKNVITSHLKGLRLDELFFIGLFEQYDQSIIELKKILNVSDDAPIPWENNNKGYKSKYQVSEEERSEIAQLNQKDIALYETVLKLKGVNSERNTQGG